MTGRWRDGGCGASFFCGELRKDSISNYLFIRIKLAYFVCVFFQIIMGHLLPKLVMKNHDEILIEH